MICLDTSFVIDYWEGEPFAKTFFEGVENEVGIPTVALFELYVGALLSDAPEEDIATVADDLDWADPIPFDDRAARDAARIDTELIRRGERINLGDALIAGTVRSRDATLVATDNHFDRVTDLPVENPRTE